MPQPVALRFCIALLDPTRPASAGGSTGCQHACHCNKASMASASDDMRIRSRAVIIHLVRDPGHRAISVAVESLQNRDRIVWWMPSIL
jgi:hypothetical protein